MTEDRQDILRIDDSSLVELIESGKRLQQELGIKEPEPNFEATIARWQAEQARREMRSYRFVIFIEPADGHFLARCPALDGLVGTGRTPEEARAVLLATLYSHLRDRTRQGWPIPTDESLTETVHVLMPA